MVNIVIRKNFFNKSIQLSPIFQKFSEFGVKFTLNEFHKIWNFNHYVVEILFKKESECVWLIFYFLYEVICEVCCSIQETKSRIKEIHWFGIFNKFALVKVKNSPNDIKRVLTIKVMNDVFNMFYTSVKLEEWLKGSFFKQFLLKRVFIKET